jgi:hypothetical protein
VSRSSTEDQCKLNRAGQVEKRETWGTEKKKRKGPGAEVVVVDVVVGSELGEGDREAQRRGGDD